MIQLPANAAIFVIHEPISFRTRLDGTCAAVRVILQKEPMDGAFFVFRNKRGHTLRIIFYDGSGYWLAEKRLSQGTFNGAWPTGQAGECSSSLLVRELQILMWAGDPASCRFPELWRKVG
jgi:transposase